jgi:DNA-binding transcriptional regulator YdaS (Cro superfamily)
VTHPLKVYLSKHEITEHAFAETVKTHGVTVSASYISQIIIGYRRPKGALAVAIADATNKSVTTDDLLRFERPTAPKKPKRRKRAA